MTEGSRSDGPPTQGGAAALSRRRFLAGSAALLGGGALVASLPGVAKAHETPEPPTDIDVLNYALTLEHLEYAFYRDGLAGFTADDFDEGVFDNLTLIRDHEGEHVELLTGAISGAGGTPVQEATYDFGYEDAEGFLEVAAALENTGVSAYDGAAQFISDPGLLTAAGSIVAVEARHASYLNLITEEVPFPASFESPLTPDEVLEIAGPFISQ